LVVGGLMAIIFYSGGANAFVDLFKRKVKIPGAYDLLVG